MKKILFTIVTTSILSAEPSAFMAGDLNSPNPYGLTKDEQFIYQNKQNIQKLYSYLQQQHKEIEQLKLQLVNYKMSNDEIKQKLQGINSVLPSFDDIATQLATLKADLNNTNVALFALKDEVAKLKTTVDKNKKVTDKSIQTIIALVEKLAQNIDKMQHTPTKHPKTTDFKSWKYPKVFNAALQHLKQGHFQKAAQMFSYLYAHNYKPATSLFYLGEIEYKQGNFKTALSFYKKSISLYPKASYTPELLYHAGYSFEKLGHKQSAKKSYLKIIKDFPKSMFVKYAKKRLKNLK
ncbi:MAG: tetratricopeptide repeat protein [Epsilonproteobacteria bacterium]|nr:tetratricopeptide repeat protein [Campylobacterota bacterium]